MNTKSEVALESTADVAKHSSVGVLLDKVDKAVKRNAAMPTGELWQFHLKPLLTELHCFHLDYTDEAMDEAGGGEDKEYQEALMEFVVDAKYIITGLTSLLMGSFAKQGFLDEKGHPVPDKMDAETRKIFDDITQALSVWTQEYPNLVEEDVPPGEQPPAAATKAVEEGAA